MMVAKGVFDDLDAVRAQLAKETRRIADPGHRVHALSAEPVQRARGLASVEPHGLLRHQPHGQCRGPRQRGAQRTVLGRAVHHHRVGLRQSRERLTQRARRQHPAIAKAARAVDHHDLAITTQAQMLQSVVREDDIGASCNQSARAGDAIPGDYGRTGGAAREDQRLVADLPPVGSRLHRARPGAAAPVTA